MSSTRIWGTRASPAAVVAAVAAVVLVCELAVALAGALLLQAHPTPAMVAARAALLAVVFSLAYWNLVRRPAGDDRRDADALLAAVPDPVALLDEDAAVCVGNDPARRLLAGGGTAGIQDGDGRGLTSILREVARGGEARRFEASLDERRLRLSVLPLLESGHGRRFAVHVADVTEAVRLRDVVALVADIDRRGMAGAEPTALLDHACRQVVAVLGVDLAWVCRKRPDGGIGWLAGAAGAGERAVDLDRAGVRWDDSAAGRGPIGTALRDGEVQVQKLSATGVQDWQKALRRQGLQAVAAVPMRIGGEVSGALVLGSRAEAGFDDRSLVTLAGIVAGRLAAALAREAEQARLRLLAATVENAAEPILVTSRDGVVQQVNAAAARLYGYAAQEIVGRNLRLLQADEESGAAWRTLSAGEAWSGEIAGQRKDGAALVVRETLTPVRDQRGEIEHVVVVQEDLTALRAAEERMRHMAQYDALTDLPNRALFFDRLVHGLAVARRNHHSMALLSLNIDHFRLVNDTFGHAAGDALLQAVAARLRQTTRNSDTVARLGGDEFAILAPQVMVREDAARVAQKVLEALRPPFDVDGQEIHVGMSIGIAVFPHDGENEEILMSRSEGALAIVKMQARNGYKFASVS